jgi:hypothetical protein
MKRRRSNKKRRIDMQEGSVDGDWEKQEKVRNIVNEGVTIILSQLTNGEILTFIALYVWTKQHQ